MNNSNYLEDGVNVRIGDEFSALCAKICRDSYDNSPYVKVFNNSFNCPFEVWMCTGIGNGMQ